MLHLSLCKLTTWSSFGCGIRLSSYKYVRIRLIVLYLEINYVIISLISKRKIIYNLDIKLLLFLWRLSANEQNKTTVHQSEHSCKKHIFREMGEIFLRFFVGNFYNTSVAAVYSEKCN